MRNLLTFIIKHWLTLGLLAASLVLVVWVVDTQRAPGSMTVVEAQGMDMTQSKPPPGVQPVAVEEAVMREMGGVAEFPATVAALSDEDVVARIPGRVSKVLVYPGERVRAGALVATLDANEIGAQADEARLMAVSKSHMALGAEHDIEERKAMLDRSIAALKGAQADKAHTQAEVDVAQAERQQAEAESAAMRADVAEMQAQQRYAAQERDREQKLYKAGAVSLDELQAATKERDMAAAKVRASQSKAQAAGSMARAAAKKVQAAAAMVSESASTIAQARAEIAAATTDLAKAYHQQDLARVEAKSYAAGAAASAVTAGYRRLFAQSDGVVAERTVSPGTAVMPGQVVLKIKSIETVRVQADLPQSMLGMVKPGTPVTVVANGEARDARIGSAFPIVDENSRTFKVEVRLANRDHSFAPGMYVKLRVHVGVVKQSLAVRSSAVLAGADGSHYVWVLQERAGGGKATDWTCTMHPEVSEPGPGKCPKCGMDLVPRERSGKYVAERRPVKAGASDGNYTAIASGLTAGDKVIWAGYENLQPGMAVQPAEWGANGPKELPQASGGSESMPGMDMPKKGTTNEGRGTSGDGGGTPGSDMPKKGRSDERRGTSGDGGSMPGMDMSQPARGRSGH